MKKLKLGILGFGQMGQLHLKNLLLIKNIDVAVADKSKLALSKAKKLGVKVVYLDYKEMLEKEHLDAVVITLPNDLHKESVIFSAEKGVDIFVEKPLARSAEECKEMIDAVKNNGVKLMVGFYQRFMDTNRKLKCLIESGFLGDVKFIVYQLFGSSPFSHRFPPSPVPEWWFKKEMIGGGVLLDNGSHMIDLMRWLLNDDLSVRYVFLSHELRLAMEDTAVLFLQSKNNGISVLLSTSWWSMNQRPNQRIDVYGYAGSISSSELKNKIGMRHTFLAISKNLIHKFLGKKIEPYLLSETGKAYYRELAHFVKCILEDKEPAITGKDGLECAKIIDDAYRLWYNSIRCLKFSYDNRD